VSRTPWLLARRHVVTHWIRTGLTLGSMAVSLFVDLPRDCQAKVAGVDEVAQVCKFQWFGGYYQDRSNFFGQFGVDPELFFEMYAKDLKIVEGPADRAPDETVHQASVRAMLADRRSTVVGSRLAKDFGWKVGDTVQIIPTIFQKVDGSAWDFLVVGIYEPLRSNVDDRTMWLRYDYLQEGLDAGTVTGPRGVGTFSVNLKPGADAAAAIDAIFENGPQRPRTTTEAAFQAAFVSMMGNVPLFVATIGGAVVFAVFFSVINTMLMAGRQRVHEVGILKALGFANSVIGRLMLGEAVVLGLVGGGLGILLAIGTESGMRAMLGTFLPNYAVQPFTLVWAAGLALLVGLVSGIAPALTLVRLRPTEAMRAEA